MSSDLRPPQSTKNIVSHCTSKVAEVMQSRGNNSPTAKVGLPVIHNKDIIKRSVSDRGKETIL